MINCQTVKAYMAPYLVGELCISIDEVMQSTVSWPWFKISVSILASDF